MCFSQHCPFSTFKNIDFSEGVQRKNHNTQFKLYLNLRGPSVHKPQNQDFCSIGNWLII